ncbi:MAG: riboflavin biosynthesis protein RibF, partial [Clostridia bacterium]|nr:riboflavin biosynthesis protein RibF [Clostridia bacterium]
RFRPMTDTVPCVLCLGNFDGVHKAHAMLVHAAAELACKLGAVPGAFCFTRPSGDYLFENAPPHLASTHRRISLLFDAGAQLAIVAPFPTMRELSAEQFLRYLEEQGCVGVVCGDDFRFGKKAAGNAGTLLQHFGQERTVIVPPQSLQDGQRISSSAIRAALGNGNAERAALMLGRPWTLCAKVYHGKHLGSHWGFPTANQYFPARSVVPAYGVYAVRCTVDGKTYNGVANVGMRPTVDGKQARVNCETHLFDYTGDLYGKVLCTAFYTYLRPERKFESADALRAAIASDAQRARDYFENFT